MVVGVLFVYSVLSAISEAMFGAGEGPIWLDEVSCIGSENELQDCPHNGKGISNCRHSEDASVACAYGKFTVNVDNYHLLYNRM